MGQKVKKHVNKAMVARILTGIVAAVSVDVFAVFRNYFRGYRHGSQASPNNVVKYRAGYCYACNHDISHLIELMKVDIEELLIILAISNETAEHFAAAKGINCMAAIPGSGALPVQFSEATSETSIFDRSGIIKLVAEELVSLEKTGVIMRAA